MTKHWFFMLKLVQISVNASLNPFTLKICMKIMKLLTTAVISLVFCSSFLMAQTILQPLNIDSPKTSRKARIISIYNVYTSLNITNCVQDWPSTEIKNRSGINSWERFLPKKGYIGEIVQEITHCNEGKIYLLKIGSYYVPIGKNGVKLIN